MVGGGEQTFAGSLPLLTYPLSVSRNAAAHVFVRSAASAVPRSSQKSLPQRVRINVINVPRRWRRRRERWQVGQLYHNAAGIASMSKWLPAPLLHRCACWRPQCEGLATISSAASNFCGCPAGGARNPSKNAITKLIRRPRRGTTNGREDTYFSPRLGRFSDARTAFSCSNLSLAYSKRAASSSSVPAASAAARSVQPQRAASARTWLMGIT